MKNTTSTQANASQTRHANSPLWHAHAVSATVTFEDDYGITIEMSVQQEGQDNRIGLSVEWYGEHADQMVEKKTVVFGLLPMKRADGGICILEEWQSPEHFREFVEALQRLADQLPYAESTIKRAAWGRER